MKSVSLADAGAEDAVRRLAMDALVSRQPGAVELVLTRPDAWRLFGIDVGTLRDDRIPGLVLTDDLEQARTYVAHQGLSRRLLITCDSEAKDFKEILFHQQGRLAVVSLSTWSEPSARVAVNGEITPNSGAPPMPSHLPLLSRPEAFNQLMSMPTLAARPAV